MSIHAGQQLLHYRLIEKIGEGGMGVVWKAEDTALHREVAIKVLPSAVASDSERLARFDREAKLLASLNHAGIASIYGLHIDGDVRFLAMEYVPGEDLCRRLARGPLSVDQALGIARQVADALQSAHENGVIHRDLKPANIVITPKGQAKVLDFGLAKAFETDTSAPVNPALSPTLTSAGTLAGAILGTAAYMSPEQARGEPVDKRSDVWAFGCVLLEMLTGRMVFKERTISDTLASVLKVEPDWSHLPAGLPGGIRRLLERCLDKQPRQRLHDIADARIEIEATLADPHGASSPAAAGTEGPPRPRARLALAAVLLLVGVAAGFGIGRNLAPAAPEQRVRRFFLPIEAEDGQKSLEAPVISPDGRTIAYVFDDRLWLHDLDQEEPRAIDGTTGAADPFWSPDSSQIGYKKNDSIWRIPASGGQPTLICDQAPLFYPPSWSADQKIIFSRLNEMLEVSARGGEPRVVFERNTDTEIHFHGVSWLPDGHGALFIVHREEGVDTLALWANGKREILMTLESSYLAEPTYSSTGHILFTQGEDDKAVWAVPFSLSSLEVTGEPFLVAPRAHYTSSASDGTLIYVSKPNSQGVELVRFAADWTVLDTIGQPQTDMTSPALSPDGTKVAVVARDDNEWDIYIHDDGGRKRRLTFEEGKEVMPRWSPDGSRILYQFPEGRGASIYTVEADGSGKPQLLIAGEQPMLAKKGDLIVFTRRGDETGGDLWWMSLETKGEPKAFLETKGEQWAPALSPDGRFVIYASDESGEPEIYIKTFPEGSGKWQVSVDGGWAGYWSPAGERLYYHVWSGLMEVEVSTDPDLQLGTPRLLFDRYETKLTSGEGIAIAEDGTSFAGIRPLKEDKAEGDAEDGIHVVENWSSEFRE